MTAETEGSSTPWNWRHPVLILVGTIVVGAIGSGLWDVGIKPSLLWLGQRLLDVVTFGSTTAKDNAYAAAALDQTAAPAARVNASVIALMCSPLLFFLMIEFGLFPTALRTLLPQQPHKDDPTEDEIETRLSRLEEFGERLGETRRKLVFIRRVLLAIFGLLIGFILTQHTIDNQSLLIWRSFHADLTQCAPYLENVEEEQIRAHYASMRRKEDYVKILQRFKEIADKHDLTLYSMELW